MKRLLSEESALDEHMYALFKSFCKCWGGRDCNAVNVWETLNGHIILTLLKKLFPRHKEAFYALAIFHFPLSQNYLHHCVAFFDVCKIQWMFIWEKLLVGTWNFVWPGVDLLNPNDITLMFFVFYRWKYGNRRVVW